MRPSKSWRKEVASLSLRSVFFWPSDRKWRSISRVKAPLKPSRAANRESDIRNLLTGECPPGKSKRASPLVSRGDAGHGNAGRGNASREGSGASRPTLRIRR